MNYKIHLILFFVLAFSSQAKASLIKYEFIGSVSMVIAHSDIANSLASVGDTFISTVIFDTANPASTTTVNFSLNSLSISQESNGTPSVFVADNGGTDELRVSFYSSFSSPDLVPDYLFDLVLQDLSGNAIINNEYPLSGNINDWTSSTLFLNVSDFSNTQFEEMVIEGTVNSFTVTAVPLPASLWLFSSGLLCLVSIVKRKYHT